MHKLVVVVFLTSMLLGLAGTAFADTQYVVQPKDTLFRIALRFHTTVGALVRANHLANPNRIFAGQVLTIPSGKPLTGHLARYHVKRGDTLWRIARFFHSSVAAIQAANRLNSTLIFTGQILFVPTR